MEKVRWPTLTPSQFGLLERMGFKSCDEFIEAIKVYGLIERRRVGSKGGWLYWFDGEGEINYPSWAIRLGPKTWEAYERMFEFMNFDWIKYITVSRGRFREREYEYEKPKTEIQYRQRLVRKIDELVVLLIDYRLTQSDELEGEEEPLTESNEALIDCIRILAKRGRKLREAKEKQVR